MSPRTALAAELEAARGDTPGEQISEMGGWPANRGPFGSSESSGTKCKESNGERS